MSKDSSLKKLSQLLADSYVLMLKTQNVHWNVVGMPFFTIHTMTEQQYTELFTAVDVIAERMRALGGKSPGTMKDFLAQTKLKEGAGGGDFASMVKELTDANNAISTELKKMVDGTDDPATEDLFVQRMHVHDKAAWMWNSLMADPMVAQAAKSVAAPAAKAAPAPKVAAPKPAATKPASAKPESKSAKAKKKKAKKPVAKASPAPAPKVEAPKPVAKPAAKPASTSKRSGRLVRDIKNVG